MPGGRGAAPTAALAQSAGDQQYADPLAGQDGADAPSAGGAGQLGLDGQGGRRRGGNDPGTTAPQATAAQPTASTAQSASGQADALPRTGLDVAPLIALGAALLTAGLLLHLVVGPPRRRRPGDPVVLFDGTLPPLR